MKENLQKYVNGTNKISYRIINPKQFRENEFSRDKETVLVRIIIQSSDNLYVLACEIKKMKNAVNYNKIRNK